MNTCLFATFITLLAFNCLSVADDNGFVDLYNKKGLSGWVVKDGNAKSWKAEGDILACVAPRGGWLRTEKEYTNFILKVDWKIPPGGNSGIGVHMPLEGDPAHAGMEIQILDDEAPQYKDKLDPGQYTGSIYYQVPAKKRAAKPAGEWNSYEITCRGPQVIVVLNGEEIVRANVDEEKVGRGGHKPLSERPRCGFIGLQSHGSRVEFRNLKVRVLD